MVGLDGQLLDGPSVLGALGLDERAAVPRHIPQEDGFPPLGAPDEVVDDQMDPVFVASIFHVDSMPTADMEYKCSLAKKQRVETPGRETRLTSPTQVGRLAAGSLGHEALRVRRRALAV